MPFYICTVRRARLNGKSQYVELIPKLFCDVWFDTRKLSGIISGINFKQPKNLIFDELLQDRNNLIYKSNYIIPQDINKIIALNKYSFTHDRDFTNKQFLAFIEHQYRAHGNMEYGLYFSIKKAENDKEFLSQINKSKVKEDQKILYYSRLDTILDYIDTIKDLLKISTPLCYYNTHWAYGKIDDNSGIYTGNKTMFYQSIENNMNIGFNLDRFELIIQIPLPLELFKFTFERYGGKLTNKTHSPDTPYYMRGGKNNKFLKQIMNRCNKV